jgi:hypothetical protein
MTTQIYAGVREILTAPDWDTVYVTDHGPFVTIVGRFNGKAHAGSRDDWKSLAEDMDRIARAHYAELLAEAEQIADEPVEVAPEPEPVIAVEPDPVVISAEQFNVVMDDLMEARPIIAGGTGATLPAPEPEPCADLLHELDALKDENAELKAELASLREDRPFPTMGEKLADYDAVGDEGMPEDLAQIMTGDETLEAAVDRMTPGIEELLDLAQVVSEQSLEKAIATIPAERFNDWTERLLDERARLRLKRGTDEENITRENLINRVANTFARVGAKR